jgi:hypothetical protein
MPRLMRTLQARSKAWELIRESSRKDFCSVIWYIVHLLTAVKHLLRCRRENLLQASVGSRLCFSIHSATGGKHRLAGFVFQRLLEHSKGKQAGYLYTSLGRKLSGICPLSSNLHKVVTNFGMKPPWVFSRFKSPKCTASISSQPAVLATSTSSKLTERSTSLTTQTRTL